jgi:hypothetical protein
MSTAGTLENPVDRELAALGERHRYALANLTRQRNAAQAAIDRELQADAVRHGFTDEQRRQYSDPELEAIAQALRARLAPLRATVAEITAEIERLPITVEAERARIAEAVEVGPPIAVRAVALQDPADADAALTQLETEIAAAVAEQATREADRATFGPMLRHATETLGFVATRRHHQLATPQELAAADRALRDVERAREANEARLSALVGQIAALETQRTARLEALETRRRRERAAAQRDADFAIGAALIPLMAAIAYRCRLGGAGLSDAPLFALLNADEPRCEAREYLQRLLECGWTPKGSR